MSVGSKIAFRAYSFIAAAFVVLAFIVGIKYALLFAVLAVLLWKAYGWLRVMRWWKRESPFTQQMIEHITARLNEGKDSSNLWVVSLTLPETAEFAKDYRVELMARPMIIEKEFPGQVDGWTMWGATRLDGIVNASPEDLESNVGTKDDPIPMARVLVARAAFEVLLAEHALKLLNVAEPRAVIARKTASLELERINSGREKGTLGQQLVDVAHARAFSSAVSALAAELGERQPQGG